MDGGANSHIFRNKKSFWKYVPTSSLIQQVSGSTATCEGIGIVLARFPGLESIFPLFPCYHMSNNPQDTLGLPPIKFYNKARSVRAEALSWLKIVHQNGAYSMMSTLPRLRHTELLDYISIDIYQLPTPIVNSSTTLHYDPKTLRQVPNLPTFLGSQFELTNRIHVSLHPPKSNKSFLDQESFSILATQDQTHEPQMKKSFSKHDFMNWSLIHRRLDHIHDDKLAVMCKKQLLHGLPKSYPKGEQNHRRDCWICPHGNLHNDPHGMTINTDHLKLGQLLHIDFYFMNKISI